MFSKCHRIGLGSPQTTEKVMSFISKTSLRTRKIALCHQSCRGRFIAKITSSPNTVCTVNHATENLQHRILYFSNYRLLHCHMKMERAREEETQMVEGTVHRVRRQKNKRAVTIQVGKTEYCTS